MADRDIRSAGNSLAYRDNAGFTIGETLINVKRSEDLLIKTPEIAPQAAFN